MGNGLSGEENTAVNLNNDNFSLDVMLKAITIIREGMEIHQRRNFESSILDAQRHFEEQLTRMDSRHQDERERLVEEMERNRMQFQTTIEALKQGLEEAQHRANELVEQLAKPVKDRQAKIDFVNGLNLPIRKNKSLYLIGPKGMGKSTFMWLLNKGERPVQSFGDGTVQILQLDGYVDSIGLRGWTPEELAKLLVLMIYDGIPKDLIIFGNDRIDSPIASLGLLGIQNPLIVIMSSDFWKNYDPPAGGRRRIHLQESNNGVRRVQPDDDLELVYNLAVYDHIKEFGLGTAITHHDDIQALVDARTEAGVEPFKFLREILGNRFAINMENNSTIEMLFRFIYVYEKKYNRDRLRFMNHATLQDF